MKRSLLLFRIVLICSCTFNRLPGSEYDWQRVYSDGAGGQLLGLEDFAFGGGVYVAVGDTNFASLNGKDWTPVASFRPNLSRVIYANGKFVAVGGSYVHYFEDQFLTEPNIVAVSTNGFDWEVVLRRKFVTVPDDSGYTGFFLADVGFAQGKFFAVGNGSGKMILTSEDAIHWTEVTTDVLKSCNGIAYGQGRFVSVGNGVMTSSNGVDWIRTQGTEQNGLFNLFSVCYGGGLFTIGGGNGIWESVDGSNWIRKLSIEGGILDGIAYGVGHRIAVGSSALYARDTGSGRWLPIAGMPPLETWGIRFANGYFYAVGSGNGIMRAAVTSPPTLLALPPGDSPGFSFLAHTLPYCDYQIDYSEDFSSWNVLTNFTSFTNSFIVTDSTAFLHQRRFYRAVAE